MVFDPERGCDHSRKMNKTDWERLDQMTDDEIRRNVEADPDAAPILDESWFRKAIYRKRRS